MSRVIARPTTTMTTTRALRALVVVIAVSAVGLAGCKKPSDEDQIRALIVNGADLLEAKDTGGALELVDESYQDDKGRDKKKLGMLALAVLRMGPVSILTSDPTITVNGDRARATFTATVIQGAAEIEKVTDVLPQRGRQLELGLALVKGDDGWRVTSIEGLGARFD